MVNLKKIMHTWTESDDILNDKIEKLNSYNLDTRVSVLENIVGNTDLTYEQIAEIVGAGLAKNYFKIGDQIVAKYTAKDGTVYDMPFDVVHFDDVELEDGSVVPGMFIQSHYATLEAVQFDAPEIDRPADKDYSGQIKQYGWNRWAYSGIRQWLNSDAVAGSWWTSQNDYDVAPPQHGTYNGFKKGFTSDFLSMIKPTKIMTCRNYRDYDSLKDANQFEHDTTYDLFFLPSNEQEYMYIQDTTHNEGTTWEYWIERLTPEATEKGERLPQMYYESADKQHILTSRIRYALENHTSAQHIRGRSAGRGNSCSTWVGYAAGCISNDDASSAWRCAPACVIC